MWPGTVWPGTAWYQSRPQSPLVLWHLVSARPWFLSSLSFLAGETTPPRWGIETQKGEDGCQEGAEGRELTDTLTLSPVREEPVMEKSIPGGTACAKVLRPAQACVLESQVERE